MLFPQLRSFGPTASSLPVTLPPHGFDSLIVGYFDVDKLMYVARTRNGFVPASRRRLFRKLHALVTHESPFRNLPEARRPRWGEALDAEKMKKAVWLTPEAVAQTLDDLL
jgi:ATP dependent DNA ligase C terminal region